MANVITTTAIPSGTAFFRPFFTCLAFNALIGICVEPNVATAITLSGGILMASCWYSPVNQSSQHFFKLKLRTILISISVFLQIISIFLSRNDPRLARPWHLNALTVIYYLAEVVVFVVLAQLTALLIRKITSLSKTTTTTLQDSLLMLIPRSQRGDIQCDLHDDVREMREAGFGELKVRFYICWQFLWSLWRIGGAKLLKLLEAVSRPHIHKFAPGHEL